MNTTNLAVKRLIQLAAATLLTTIAIRIGSRFGAIIYTVMQPYLWLIVGACAIAAGLYAWRRFRRSKTLDDDADFESAEWLTEDPETTRKNGS